MKLRTTLCFLALAVFVLISCKNSSSSNNDNSGKTDNDTLEFAEDKANLELPDDFEVVEVADDIGAARRVVIRENGDMYVSLNSKKDGNPLVALRDTTGNGKADVIKYFGEGVTSGTGLRIHDDYLYYGSDTAVVRYRLDPKQLLPHTDYETVTDLPHQNEHEARSLAFDNEGHMYVNIGAPSNSCQEEDRKKGSMGQDPCPLLENHGGIWKFDADETDQTQDDGERYVTGVRNAVALDWNPNADKLYAVMHGRDQLHQLFPDLYDEKESAELPGEEFLKFEEGNDYGWPYIYWDQKNEEFVKAPEYGGDGEETVSGDKYEKPLTAFPGHWAPNGLLFYTGDQFPDKYKNGAFIAFHGSWNRAPEPQKGYKVVYVPFDGEQIDGDSETFADNFAGTSEAIENPGDADHRPNGLYQGQDGSLYVTDDHNGAIFRIVYTGNKS